MLLIMGTSLKTDGVKFLVKDFAKVVHERAGKVVFVNLTEPSKSAWDGVIDYWVEWDCDAWVRDLVVRQPALSARDGEGMRRRNCNPTIREPNLQEAKSWPRVLIDLSGDDQQVFHIDSEGEGSSRDNPVDLMVS
jgi:NAD-dependent histone deacetylase SIR2